MKDKIEIYVRQSAGSNFLTLYIPERLRKDFIAGIADGRFQSNDSEVNLELFVLPEWMTNAESKKHIEDDSTPIHIRIPISVINTYFDSD